MSTHKTPARVALSPRPDRQAATGAPSPVAATQTQRIQGAICWLSCPLLWLAGVVAFFYYR